MTTLIRVTEQPPSAAPFDKVNNIEFSEPGKESTEAPFGYKRVTFQPVASPILSEIIGYTGLGLADMGLSGPGVAAMLFKWHTWLTRMNDWMLANQKLYPKLIDMPDVKIPSNLYFLGTVGPDDWKKQIESAITTSLGPLLPADKNTLVNAFARGVRRSHSPNGGDTSESMNLVNTYGKFIRDVNKLASYAVSPQKNPLATITKQLEMIPLPPVVKHVVETFTTSPFADDERNRKSGNFGLKDVPLWVWVVAVAAILYYFNKNASSSSASYISSGGSATRNIPKITQWSKLIGGSGKVLDISDFSVPR